MKTIAGLIILLATPLYLLIAYLFITTDIGGITTVGEHTEDDIRAFALWTLGLACVNFITGLGVIIFGRDKPKS